jgi:hypothetical protein
MEYFVLHIFGKLIQLVVCWVDDTGVEKFQLDNWKNLFEKPSWGAFVDLG